MSPRQNSLYWREWRAAAEALARHGRAHDSGARHALHAQALGADMSHKAMLNADLDRVLAAFRAWSQPADLNAQLRAEDQPQERTVSMAAQCFGVLTAIERCGKEFTGVDGKDSYLHGLTRRLFGLSYDRCTDVQLAQAHGVLKRQLARMSRPAVTAPAAQSEDAGNPF